MSIFRQQPYQNTFLIIVMVLVALGIFLMQRVFADQGPTLLVTVSPTSQTVVRGATATYTATLEPKNGYDAFTTLTMPSCPFGATCLFNGLPPPVTYAIATTKTVAITVQTNAGTQLGTQNFTFGAYTNDPYYQEWTNTLTMTVTASGDFSIGVNPDGGTPLVVHQGETSTPYTVTVTSLNDFTGMVDLSVQWSKSPNGNGEKVTELWDGSPTPPTISLEANRSVVIQLQYVVAADTTVDNYVFSIKGHGGNNLDRSNPEPDPVLTVARPEEQDRNFTIDLTPWDGNSLDATFTALAGHDVGSIYVAADAKPIPLPLSAVPGMLVVGTRSATSHISVPNRAVCGNNITLCVRELGYEEPAACQNVQVPCGDYRLEGTQPYPSVDPDETVQYVIKAVTDNEFGKEISITASTDAPGIIVTPYNGRVPAKIYASRDGSEVRFSVSADGDAACGSYTITFDGTAEGGFNHSLNVPLTVCASDFSITSITPNPLTLDRASSGTYTVTINRAGGYTGDVTIHWTASPSP